MAGGYVRFAAEQPALFGVVFAVGLDKKQRYPELREAYEDVEDTFVACVAELCPDDPSGAEELGDAIEATAHGYAALLTDQPGTPDPAVCVTTYASAAGNRTIATSSTLPVSVRARRRYRHHRRSSVRRVRHSIRAPAPSSRKPPRIEKSPV